MNYKHVLFLLILGILCLICTSSPTTETERKDLQNYLYTKLYKEVLIQKSNQNIIFSPYSIQLCLALAHLGANGTTAHELAEAIGYSSNLNARLMSTFLVELHKQDILHVANKIYVKSGYDLHPTYQTSVRDELHSDVESIEFSQNVAAAKTINAWIEKQTNHMIKDIVKSDSFDDRTRLTLVNAIYFKALWKQPFSSPVMKKFTNHDASSSDVQMMQRKGFTKLVRMDDLKAYFVKLEYRQTGIAMYLIIPDEVDGLPNIERKLDNIDFKVTSRLMDSMYIKLEVPKFDFELDLDLKDILKRLGVVRAFTDAAEFPNILQTEERLQISDAVHKAFIKVDETGTEAGASTVMTMALNSIPPKIQLNLTVDRPFLFAIWSDEYDNAPLFIGSVKHL